MEPHLVAGQTVGVESRALYWPGDIVAFRPRDSGPFRVHRVLGLRLHGVKVCLVTKGDRLQNLDAPVPLESVLGRVCHGAQPTRLSHRLEAVADFLAHAASAILRRLS